MFPMDRKPTPVSVEYTSRNTRVVKCFDDAFTARRFYAAKYRAGAEPKVIAARRSTMSDSTTQDVTTETPATATAPKKAAPKKAVKKVATKPQPASKKAAPKKAEPKANKAQKESKWLMPVAKYLKKYPDGRTRAQIKEHLQTNDLAGVIVKNPQYFKCEVREDVQGHVISLTAAGRKLVS